MTAKRLWKFIIAVGVLQAASALTAFAGSTASPTSRSIDDPPVVIGASGEAGW